jgi:hypothetical protein
MEPQRHALRTWLEESTGSDPDANADAVKEIATLYGSPELHAIQNAAQKLNKQQRRELRDWLEAVDQDETPGMLAAIDEGLRSLAIEPTISIEEVRREMASWNSRADSQGS